MNFFYKTVFILFGISIILPVSMTGNFKYSFSKCVLVLISIFVLLFHTYDTIYLIHSKTFSTAMLSADVTGNVILFFLRYRLGRRLDALKRIASLLSDFKIKETRSSKFILYFWIAVSTLSHLLLFASVLYGDRNFQYISNLFGIAEDTNALYYTCVVFYAFYSSILMILPLNTFAVFFAVVCYHVRSVLKDVSSKLSNDCLIDYQKILQSCNSFKRIIDMLDDELSFFVLCEVLYTSSVLFFTISGILRSDIFVVCLTCLDRISFFCHLVNSLLIFFVITVSASMVSESYAKVWINVNKLIANIDTDFTFRQQKSMFFIEKEANFTIWKIVPVNRSFILGTFGTIITYIMLFDNFMYARRKS